MHFVKRGSCPACKSTDTTTLCELEYTQAPIKGLLTSKYAALATEYHFLEGERYVLDECDSCRLIFQKNIPDGFLMRKLYEDWADGPDGFAVSKRNHGLEYFTKHADRIVNVLRYMGKNPYDLRVFDFAFGWGHWCRLLKGFGCELYGTELSEKRLRCAEEIGIKVIPPENIQDSEFDWINAHQVFEHIANPLETLIRLKAAMKPNGIITISLPGGRNIRKKIERSQWKAVLGSDSSGGPLLPLEHINYFPKGVLCGMAKSAGLTPVAIAERFVLRGWRPALKRILKSVCGTLGIRLGANILFKNEGCPGSIEVYVLNVISDDQAATRITCWMNGSSGR